MTKQEIRKIVQDVFELKSADIAGEKLAEFEERLLSAVEFGDKVTIAEVTIELDEKKETSGVSRLRGEDKPWSKPKHMSVKVKPTQKLKDRVYREL